MRGTIEKELLSRLLELEQSQQEKVLEYIKRLLKENKEKDFSDDLSAEQISSIEKGLQQIKEGKTVPHKKVRKRYEKWL